MNNKSFKTGYSFTFVRFYAGFLFYTQNETT